jgi:hypothetical protein
MHSYTVTSRRGSGNAEHSANDVQSMCNPSRATRGDGDGDLLLPAAQTRERVRLTSSMWILLLRIRFASIACPGSWILSPSCRAASAPGATPSAPLLPPFVFLVEASVTDDVVPANLRVLASALVRHSLSAFALLPASRVAGRCPFPFCPARVAEAKAWRGRAWVSIWFFCTPKFEICIVPGILSGFPSHVRCNS